MVVSLPLIMAFVALAWERGGEARLTRGWWGLISLNIAANALPLLPRFDILKDLGLATYGALALWATGLCITRERPLDRA